VVVGVGHSTEAGRSAVAAFVPVAVGAAAALLRRAKDLGRMPEAAYLTAIKTASARGWRRLEPVPLGRPEQPRRLLAYIGTPAGRKAQMELPRNIIAAVADATTVA